MAVYVMEVYHRSEGDRRPTLLEKSTIIAADDTAAIARAEIALPSLDTPEVTGFVLRSPGQRHHQDRIVYDYIKKNGAFATRAATPPANGHAAAVIVVPEPPNIAGNGEQVIDVPPLIGFDC